MSPPLPNRPLPVAPVPTDYFGRSRSLRFSRGGLVTNNGDEQLHVAGRVSERCCHRPLPSEPDVRVSPHPAQAAAKPRASGAGLHDGLNPGLMAMDAELLEERTFFEVGPPLWVKRVGGLSDFDMTPDFGVAGIDQAAPYRLAFRRLFTRLKRKVPSSFCGAWKITPLHPVLMVVGAVLACVVRENGYFFPRKRA